MRYVQINTVPNGSTGSVMFREQEKRLAAGDECWAMWGRGRAAENDHELNFGTKAGFYLDVVRTRLDDRTVFKPTPSDFRERYGIGDRFMILGVASPWSKRKGRTISSG